MIDYLWGIGRPYFIYKGFLPFMYLTLLPTILVPISQTFLEKKELNEETGEEEVVGISVFAALIHILFLLLMTIGNFRNILWELLELMNSGWSYFTSTYNYI